MALAQSSDWSRRTYIDGILNTCQCSRVWSRSKEVVQGFLIYTDIFTSSAVCVADQRERSVTLVAFSRMLVIWFNCRPERRTDDWDSARMAVFDSSFIALNPVPNKPCGFCGRKAPWLLLSGSLQIVFREWLSRAWAADYSTDTAKKKKHKKPWHTYFCYFFHWLAADGYWYLPMRPSSRCCCYILIDSFWAWRGRGRLDHIIPGTRHRWLSSQD